MATQRGLFDARPETEQVLLNDSGCRVRYWEAFLQPTEAQSLFDALLREAPLETETVTVRGQTYVMRRKSCAFGDQNVREYRYAGVVLVPHPWPAALLPIVDRLTALLGCRFSFALCSLYPDGAVGLGWHSDDEQDLEPGTPIASLSLGAARDFQVRPVGRGQTLLTQALAHGSLLTMEGASFQQDYQHSVPKRLRCLLPRINLTFRRMRTP